MVLCQCLNVHWGQGYASTKSVEENVHLICSLFFISFKPIRESSNRVLHSTWNISKPGMLGFQCI